ncbi:hypothetical protein HYC85_000283 [Camellia sinensis]|uniref:PGG domain-containing protein n=1 Tax=Camellia sinensis TaxID=4442 RepID=A0A7J7I3T7_CAMSI|nr:hypothetical protein HYC85_000283 [Camellia sinensis]
MRKLMTSLRGLAEIFWCTEKKLLNGIQTVPCIKDIREKNLVHKQAVELVKFLCDQIANANYSKAKTIFSLSLVQATSVGIYEIVQEILISYPDAISLQNGKNQSIFHQAIAWRHEQVFNLIRQIGKSRTVFLGQCDDSQSNALHLAEFLAPQEQLYRRVGAALQMQRELQWFKNKEGKTPAQIFTETHKDLIKDGEQWLKDTANASTIVAALIATVVFAAAITVPGGNNGDGYPVFYKRASFLIFGISDAFALFSSMTSVLLFLSILTSRYGENDFLVIIPRRLIFGLISLFLSILSTMIAFGATLYLVFGDSYKTWIIFLMLVLPGIPAILFVFLQFPLLVDMYKSTYCTIFAKQDADMLY